MSADLVRTHDYDERTIAVDPAFVGHGQRHGLDIQSFRDERFRSLWHRLQFVALRGAQQGTIRLPRPLRNAVVRAVAGAARRVDRRHREAALDYVRTAMPGADPQTVTSIARDAWRHMVRVALVSEGIAPRVMGRRFGDHYEVYMADGVREVLDRGEGALLVTAHAGYWEACCPGLVGLGVGAGYAVGKAPRNDFVARHLHRLREAQGMRLIPQAGAMGAVPKAVRAGGFVGLLLDHRPKRKPIIVPFFGRPAGCDRSAAVLIRRVKAPLVFYGCYSVPGTDPLVDWRFQLRFTRAIESEQWAGLDVGEITAQVNRELEALILHRPREVFWVHDRYKGVPPAAPSS